MKNSNRKTIKSQDVKKVKGYLKKPTEKKLKIEIFGKYMEEFVSMSMKSRISECGDFIGFLKTADNDIRLSGGNFCNNRFCPMCAWRKARKDGYLIYILIAYIEKIYKKKFIFLTLTAANVPDNELSKEIDDFNKSWKRLFQTKEVKAMNKGYIRKLEVTYNKKRNDYHPHFHILLAVNQSYFSDKDYYITRNKWLEMWQNAKRDKTITQVDIRRAKMDDFKSVLEIATYSAKSSEYLLNSDVFKVFYENLKGRQLITYNGLFKDALKLFKDGEMDDFKEVDENIYIAKEWYKWTENNYKLEWEHEVLIENLEKVYKDEIEID